MIIFNIMMSKGKGGLENVLVDYSLALSEEGIRVHTISNPAADINQTLKAIHHPNISNHFIHNPCGNFDPFFVYQYHKLIKKFKPDVIICHGNRALNLNYLANKHRIPCLTISHTYWLRHAYKSTHWIALSQDLKQALQAQNIPEERISLMSNMINITNNACEYKSQFSDRIIIGSYGRLDHAKGFDVLIEAIKILNDQGLNVQLHLGGSGTEENHLKSLVSKHNLDNKVHFLGWVTDKEAFFNHIDIFCLPSRKEAFGLVLLEAFMHKRLVIASKVDGPKEIIMEEETGIFFEKENPYDLAEKIKYIKSNPLKALAISKAAYQNLQQTYDLKVVGKKLVSILTNICRQ